MFPTPDSSNKKLLFVSSDKFPLIRVDVKILFGMVLAGRGFQIDWILQSRKNLNTGKVIQWKKSLVYLGKSVNGESVSQRLRKHIYQKTNEFNLLKAVKSKKYTFIIVKDLFIAGALAVLASKLYKVKLLYWLSFPLPESDIFEVKTGSARYPLFYLLRGSIRSFLLYKVILPNTHHIFVQSRQMKIDVRKKGIPGYKMTPVPMGIHVRDIPYYGYPLTDTGGNRSKNIVYLGTLIKSRRMDFLLRVMVKVLQVEKSAKLIFVGGGEDLSDEAFLLKEATRLKVDHAIVITGKLPQKEAWRVVKKADVCVSPYFPSPILNSTSPTKIIEYMALGKAVVANNHPEQSLIIAESKAGLAVPYDESAFSEAILSLFDNSKLAIDMGKRGREYVKNNRDYEKIANIVEEKLNMI